jgi:hypothetical protein
LERRESVCDLFGRDGWRWRFSGLRATRGEENSGI